MRTLGPLNPVEREIYASVYGAALLEAFQVSGGRDVACDTITREDICARTADVIATRAVEAFRRLK